jgi:predicted acyl esterase
MYEVKIDLWPTAYIFNQGHRLRLAVSSSNYPRFTATPNNGWPLAEEGPIYIANNTILMGGSLESRVTLPLVPLSAIPPNIAPDP